MSFISYAQNFEDVMLWRALKHVEVGFYIDVGANDPSIESVTKAFYERGWSGINIEPLPSHHSDLQVARKRDVNLQCAAGVEAGFTDVWACDVRGWATADSEVVARHVADGRSGVFHTVPVRTLKDICEKHAMSEIHFLKIDVEGFEKAVIAGMDFSRFRPWILLVEATRPNSTEETYCEWEPEVFMAEYQFAYSDGLNRFYVAKEHSELLSTFRYPPNVFDRFIRAEQLDSQLRAQRAEATAHQIEAKVQQAEAKAQQAEAAANYALAQVATIYGSTSWKVTEPLRAIGRLLKCVSPQHINPRIQLFLRHSALYVNRRPKLRRFSVSVLNKFPKFKHRISEQIHQFSQDMMSGQEILIDLSALTPRALKIHDDLKVAIIRSKLQQEKR